MKRLEIKQNQRFGKLTIIKEVEPLYSPQGKTRRIFECKCDCGNIKNIRLSLLTSNQTTSCGCFHKQTISNIFKKHGDSLTPEYICWVDIQKRCNNPKNKYFKDYGGRGIKLHQSFNKWEDFKQYLLDTIGLRPSSLYSLDRINNDKGYEPNNLRWATKSEQNKNKRTNGGITRKKKQTFSRKTIKEVISKD